MTKGNGQVEEAASVGDPNIGFQQPLARGQAYLCETPDTSYEFNLTG